MSPKSEPAPSSVLDASALLAFVQGEEGRSVVAAELMGRAAISVVNWAEVLSKIAAEGRNPMALEINLRERGFIGKALSIEPMTEADCVAIARLRPITKSLGLSLADRACLVLAKRLGVSALTADGSWSKAVIGAEVRLIRRGSAKGDAPRRAGG